MGTGFLSNTPSHHSHMAYSLDTLAALDCVPGNSYRWGPRSRTSLQWASVNVLLIKSGSNGQAMRDTLPLPAGHQRSFTHPRLSCQPPCSYYNPLAAGTLDGGGGGNAPVGAKLPPLHAVAMDSGTWPMDGGGVATCREQARGREGAAGLQARAPIMPTP
jgi:hypothetical protein